MKSTDPDFRLNLEGDILAVIANYGGERIGATPTMDRMVKEIAAAVIARLA